MKTIRCRLAVLAILLLCNAAVPAAEQVTIAGEPHLLAGNPVQVGDLAPDFTALDVHFQPVGINDYRGQTVVISTVPSIDTPVCSIQTKTFHNALGQLPDVRVITVSMDLPFAQKRFCLAEGITGMIVLSDSSRREFGEAWGVLIPSRGLLARAVFVIGEDGRVEYRQVVPELTEEPDYAAVMAVVARLTGEHVPLDEIRVIDERRTGRDD